MAEEAAAAPACDADDSHDEDDEKKEEVKERIIRSELHHDHGAGVDSADLASAEEEEESGRLCTTAYRFRLVQVDADGDAVVPRRQRRQREEDEEVEEDDGVLTVRFIIAVSALPPHAW